MAKQVGSGKKTTQVTWDTFKPRTKRPMSGVIVIKPKKKASKPTAKTSKPVAKATPKAVVNNAGVKVGDIFYTSWGYDQTNINFYQVVGITAGGCYIRPIFGKEVREKSYTGSDAIVAAPNHFKTSYDSFVVDKPGGVFKRIQISGYNKEPYIRLASFAFGWLYKGEILYETAAGYGH